MPFTGSSETILALAVNTLEQWNTGRPTLDDCADSLRHENAELAAPVLAILYTYFRHKGRIDSMLGSAAASGHVKPKLQPVCACALVQALFQNGIAPESAVNVAVDFVKNRIDRHAAGFVNAVLRNALRNAGKGPFPASFPEKLAARWKRQYGPAADSMAAAAAQNPPVVFRLRPGFSLPEKPLCIPLPELFPGFVFFRTEDPAAVIHSAFFTEGGAYVQDPATALSISLCRSRIRGNVLDSCAAPGGKTAMLCDFAAAGTKITAADRSSARLDSIRENLRRLRLGNVALRVMDSRKPDLPERSFDLVFADVPCTNTGVVRRRPDALWRFTSARLNETAALQSALLDSLSKLVAPGGALLYSTCSIELEENARQIAAFLRRSPEFALETEKQIVPETLHDGAYAALLVRKA